MQNLIALFGFNRSLKPENGDQEEKIALVSSTREARDDAGEPRGEGPSSKRVLLLSIDGMHCTSCSSSIENALRFVLLLFLGLLMRKYLLFVVACLVRCRGSGYSVS